MIVYVYVYVNGGMYSFYNRTQRSWGRLCSEGAFLSLLVSTVLIVFLTVIICPLFSSRVVKDVAVGLNEVLLLFEMHLQNPFDHNKGNASLSGRAAKALEPGPQNNNNNNNNPERQPARRADISPLSTH